jgi:ribonucleoside-diphosphate reductase alpha chain
MGLGEGESQLAGRQPASMDEVKRFASTGYVRNLIVFHGGQSGAGNGAAKANGAGEAASHASVMTSVAAGVGHAHAVAGSAALAVSTSVTQGGGAIAVEAMVADAVDDRLAKIREAKLKGYEGDACGECGNFTLVRNGTCMKCTTCGSTSGCS